MDPNNVQTPEPARVLLIDKPLNWTSFDAVKKLKFAGKIKKIGHAGTLDPLATGLLIICTGKMTKQIDSFQAQQKEYTGSFVLGKTTPSVDLETEFDAEFATDHISAEVLETARKEFLGEIEQYPPIYSAVKVNGKKLYELARKGKTAEIKSRIVTIAQFDIDTTQFPEISFVITCSKGTYIRSLVRDFGEKCLSGAYLKSLRRTKIGDYNVANSMTIEACVEFLQAELQL
jgi:tRNA pseudouridine55 synthase